VKTLLAATAASVALLAPAGAAQAALQPVDEGGDSGPCVTYDEFNVWLDIQQTGYEMPENRVKRIFDTPGRRVGGDGVYFRAYPACDGATVTIYFNADSPRHLATGGTWSD
jgi:opacity protein-like surface antigen